MSDTPPPGYVSVPEAYTQLGISRQRAYQLIRMGTLPSEKIGNRVWVPQAAVEARLAAEGRLTSNQCVSTREAAEFFGVDISTIHQWRRQGHLTPTKVNNTLCFDINQIVNFIPPRHLASSGRYPARTGTRMLRGRYHPLPEIPERNTVESKESEPEGEP